MLSVICFTVNFIVMENSYFILISEKIEYPLYVVFKGYLSIKMLRERDVLWTVIRHLTQLDYDDFVLIERCTSRTYDGALIKLDFT